MMEIAERFIQAVRASNLKKKKERDCIYNTVAFVNLHFRSKVGSSCTAGSRRTVYHRADKDPQLIFL